MSNDGAPKRESLKSRLGFIFLSAGCAIGLGNVWRFPFIVGRYGGAAFVLIYLVFLILLVSPIMVMEFAVGRASRQAVIHQFSSLEPKGSSWHIYGPIAAAGNIILMMFYTVVTGWMLAYFWYYASGAMDVLTTAEEVGAHFGAMLASPATLLFWMSVAIAIGSIICGVGLQNGAERVTKVMMTGLLAIMLVLVVRSATLDGASEGLKFYLVPDFGRLAQYPLGEVIFAALGQAFFTLSVGIGSLAIFGSYISRERALTGESLTVALLDTVVAVFAGLIIFPACFAYGVEPTAGPGLLFVSLPNMFMKMPGGRVWGALFFLFMSFAAMSTVIAVFEHIIANWMDGCGWSRTKASTITFFLMLVLAAPCALGFNVMSWFQPLGEGSVVLDLEDFIVSNHLLPIGALVYALFCCSRKGWGWDSFIKEANTGRGMKFPVAARGFVTWVLPIIVLAIFVMGYYEKFFRG